MEAFFLVGAVQALFFAILVFNKQGDKQVADVILAIWLIMLSLTLIIPYFVYKDGTFKYFYLFSIDLAILASQPVWFYIYTLTLTEKTNKFNPKLLLHFIPVIIVIVVLFMPLFKLSPDEIKEIYNDTRALPKITMYGGFPASGLINIYILLSLRRILIHRKNIKYTFSYEENVDLRWLLNLAITFVVILLLVSATIGWYIIATPGNILFYDLLVGFCYVVFIFVLGYFGFKQGKIFGHVKIYIKEDTKNNQSTRNVKSNKSPQEENVLLATKLSNYVSEQKPWLNPKLSLYDLANELNVTSHQLSSLLNDYLKTNFYDYINHYRVEEVKKRLEKNTNQFTILATALECGFNSKASFNRIFKQKTGKTPSEFMKSRGEK